MDNLLKITQWTDAAKLEGSDLKFAENPQEYSLWRLLGKEAVYAVLFGHSDVYVISECVHFVDP